MTNQQNLPALIEKMQPEFAKALGGAVPSERFTRIAVTAIKTNPDLAGLERNSLFKGIMQAAQDGLIIDGKEAAIIPFKGKAQYLPMVAGLVKKIRQHSEFANLSHGIIYQGEVDSGAFEYVKGDEERLTHKPMLFGDRGKPIGAYAIATMKDGTKFRAVLTKADIEKRRDAGRAGNGPWASWTDEMWIKTAIKALYKIAPNSGDESGVLDQVMGRDEDELIEHEPAPEPAAADAPKRTRAAEAVKAAQPQAKAAEPAPAEEIEDAEYSDLPVDDRNDWGNEENEAPM